MTLHCPKCGKAMTFARYVDRLDVDSTEIGKVDKCAQYICGSCHVVQTFRLSVAPPTPAETNESANA